MGQIWERMHDGVSGIGAEILRAGKDVYRDPWILWDTAKNVGRESYETARGAVEFGAKAVGEFGGALDDVRKDPRILAEAVGATIYDVGDALKASGRAVQWVGGSLSEAANDTYANPKLFGDTLLGMYEDITGAARTVRDVVTDPDKAFNGVKMLTGAESLENALDPNRSLSNRIGQVGLGVIGIYGTLTGARGLAQAVKGGATTLIGKVSGAAGNVADDAARLAAGGADDAARLASGSADEATGLATGATDDGVSVIGDDYATHLKNRTRGRHSTIRPGSADDFVPAEGVVPDTSGYARVSEKNIQMLADKYGVRIHTRPTNPLAREMLESGTAFPKPELLKNKSISELDTLIGANADELGKVGHFNPRPPPEIGTRLPNGNIMTQDLYEKTMKRFAERADEFKNQAKWLQKHADQFETRGNLVIDKETGLPFTGDVDGFAIRGMYGEALPKAVVEQIQKELIQGPGHVKHGFHTEWDYSRLSRRAPPGGADSKFEVAKGIDQKIRRGHAPDGEALVTYSGREATRPGMAPNPEASWWMGGLDNPLVLQQHVRPVAEKYGVKIMKSETGFRITGLRGEELPSALVEQIGKELAHLLS